MVEWIYLILSVVITVLSFLTAKKAMVIEGTVPAGIIDAIPFLIKATFLNYYSIASFGLTLLAGICWRGAISRMDINLAIPLSIALTLLLSIPLSILLFHEVLTIQRLIGLFLLIMACLFLFR